jgi:hypothetical protein
VVVRPLIGTPIWSRQLLLWRTTAMGGELAEVLFGAATAAYQDLIADAPQVRRWSGAARRPVRS